MFRSKTYIYVLIYIYLLLIYKSQVDEFHQNKIKQIVTQRWSV